MRPNQAKTLGAGHCLRAPLDGEGSASIVTTKKLLVRLEAPRFFRERDRVVISAVVHNRLSSAKRVKPAASANSANGMPLRSCSRAKSSRRISA